MKLAIVTTNAKVHIIYSHEISDEVFARVIPIVVLAFDNFNDQLASALILKFIDGSIIGSKSKSIVLNGIEATLSLNCIFVSFAG